MNKKTGLRAEPVVRISVLLYIFIAAVICFILFYWQYPVIMQGKIVSVYKRQRLITMKIVDRSSIKAGDNVILKLTGANYAHSAGYIGRINLKKSSGNETLVYISYQDNALNSVPFEPGSPLLLTINKALYFTVFHSLAGKP